MENQIELPHPFRIEHECLIKNWIHPGLKQYIFRFSNNWGASIIPEVGFAVKISDLVAKPGYWELAVAKFTGPEMDDWDFDDEEEISHGDPIRFQTVTEISELLERIARL
jgi:hypothetical protein